jgi:hypothetical protein
VPPSVEVPSEELPHYDPSSAGGYCPDCAEREFLLRCWCPAGGLGVPSVRYPGEGTTIRHKATPARRRPRSSSSPR